MIFSEKMEDFTREIREAEKTYIRPVDAFLILTQDVVYYANWGLSLDVSLDMASSIAHSVWSKMDREERGRYERKKYEYRNKAVTNLNHIPPPGLIKFIPNVHLYVRSAALIEKENVRHAEKIYEFLKDAYCTFQN